MDLTTYQQEAMKTRIFVPENRVAYSALGLAGEAGELANKVRKISQGNENDPNLIAGIKGEMGDVLWYLAALADDLGVSLADIAAENIEKLKSRVARGAINGAGDTR